MKCHNVRRGRGRLITVVLISLFLTLTIQGCGGRAQPETEAAVAVDTATPRANSASTGSGASSPASGTVMQLRSQQSKTEYSPRREPFTPPASLSQIREPSGGTWQTIQPGREIDFRSYDNVRVRDNGMAILDLGNHMRLLLKQETVLQQADPGLVAQAWQGIRVGAVNTPPLQELILSLHLLRGGCAGRLDPGSGPIALTTPNAVVIVSGTTFFVVYDPAARRTWVGNFGGEIAVGDIPDDSGVDLWDRTMIAIPPINGERFFDLPPDLTDEGFADLVDLSGTPSEAAETLSGPLLVVEANPGLDVYSEPSRQARQLGLLPRGSIVPILSHIDASDGGYWEIACPPQFGAGRNACWVSDDGRRSDDFRADGVPRDAVAADRDRDGVVDAQDLCPGDPAGNRPDPARRGCPLSQQQDEDIDRDGWPNQEDNCPNEPDGDYPDPERPGCPAGDSDGDGYLDYYEDECPQQTTAPQADPYRPGCPAIDSDRDGWYDFEDSCRDEPEGEYPDPERPGCPSGDRDGDGVIDAIDQCPNEPRSQREDPYRPGCPESDWDNDGYLNHEDVCPEKHEGIHPNPDRPGCPDEDSDGDGYYNHEDQCPIVHTGYWPDPLHPGCPRPDSDNDSWFDDEDECPYEPAGDWPDEERPGCPWPGPG